MSSEKLEKVIHAQYDDLIASYPGLELTQLKPDVWCVRGKITLSAIYNTEKIEDEYVIELIIPPEYPSKPPLVKEVGGRIPKDFHTNPNEALCLGAPLEIKRKFAQTATLLGFLHECVIPFLYSFSYKKKHGVMPFGELSHGGKGILEYYYELLDIDDAFIVLRFLKLLIDDSYRGHHDCPCESGLRLRYCHSERLLDIKKYQNADGFMHDYIQIAEYIIRTTKTKLPYDLAPKKYQRILNKKSQRTGIDGMEIKTL